MKLESALRLSSRPGPLREQPYVVGLAKGTECQKESGFFISDPVPMPVSNPFLCIDIRLIHEKLINMPVRMCLIEGCPVQRASKII